MTSKNPLYLLLAMALVAVSLSALVSCGHDDDDDTVYSYSTSQQTTLITAFALQADADVLANLDSVHFTVDYDNGKIYNADSLPVGTDITELKVTVTFLNTVSSAIFNITGAKEHNDTTVEYTSSMTKSLDFTGKTTLTVTSADGQFVKDYDIRVLVHKVNPDSLAWPLTWRRDLPGYRSGDIGYKAVKQGDLYRAMVTNGSETRLYTAAALNQGTWSGQTLDLPFTPRVETLTATRNQLFVLASDGTLYSSPDGSVWASAGVTWHSLLGAYGDRVLGVIKGGSAYYYDEYPRPEGYTATPVEDGFPVWHSSDMIETDNTWTTSQQAMLVGGIDSRGDNCASVWGYDGRRWGKINSVHSDALPALADPTLFSYYTYKAAGGVRRYERQQTWFVMGGRKSDGTLNDKIYISNTQGVLWAEGDSTLEMPRHLTKFYGAQAFVNFETLNATASYLPRRVQSLVTSWECPYIYLLGGYASNGTLLPYIWKGVYIRLANYPVY